MKKLVIILSLFFIALPVSAQVFQRDLYFGLRQDDDVRKLQEFLTEQTVYAGPITGNFFSLTLGAVRTFQVKEGILPSAGYFGPITRGKANAIIDVQVKATEQQAIGEVGSPPPPISTSTPELEIILSLKAQIANFQEQLKVMQQQLAEQKVQTQKLEEQKISIEAQKPILEKIQEQTAPPPPPPPLVIPIPKPVGQLAVQRFDDEETIARNVVVETKAVPILKLRFSAANEPIRIKKITFRLPIEGMDSIQGIGLFDERRSLAIYHEPNYYGNKFEVDYEIPADTSMIFVVRVNLGSLGMGADPGDKISATLSAYGFEAERVESKTFITDPGPEITGNPITVTVCDPNPGLLQYIDQRYIWCKP